ncbi:MAG: hypothetical protein LBT05_00685 [Planctomycetaceae bacterium]|jgi:hypothetical protein|nr:hypothetical protein [Planctomycetaceae bacterium]
MQNDFLKFYLLGFAIAAFGLLSDNLVYGQLRTPPRNVKALVVESDNLNERDSIWQANVETNSADSTITKQEKIPAIKVAQSQPAYLQQAELQSSPNTNTTQALSTQTVPSTSVQQTSEQIHVRSIAPAQIVGFPPGIIPPGTIIIPVTIPQYTPPIVNQSAQLVIPPQFPQMYPPIYPQPYFPPQNMTGFYPYGTGYGYPSPLPPQPVQQPIPTRMILPDGSTVSIKHYMPGSFLRNVWRAVTP